MYDFEPIRDQFREMRKRHPGHSRDISRFQSTVEAHIKKYGQLMILHRQSHRKGYLSEADKEVEKVLKIMNQVSKWEVMSLLSRQPSSD